MRIDGAIRFEMKRLAEGPGRCADGAMSGPTGSAFDLVESCKNGSATGLAGAGPVGSLLAMFVAGDGVKSARRSALDGAEKSD